MATKLGDPDVLANSFSGNDLPELRVSSFLGLPSLWISDMEIQALAVPFQFSLVGFFPSKRPSLDSIRRFFFNLKLNGEVSATLLDSSHILIKLANDLDYCRVFCHRSYLVYNCYMKLTKWSPLVDIGVESPVIPIWVSFPLLRPHLFAPRILNGLASLFGKPLKIDSATSIGSRPSVARVLVELDITKAYPDKCLGHVVGSYRPVVYLTIPSKDSYKVLNKPVLINSAIPLSVPSEVLPVTEVLGVANIQVATVNDQVDCNALPLDPQVLVVENNDGLGNDGVVFNVSNSVVAAGESASVEVMVEPFLVNGSVDHLASPLDVSAVPAVPCVDLPIAVELGLSRPVPLDANLTDSVNIPISVEPVFVNSSDEPLSTSLAGVVFPVVHELANPSSESLGHWVEVDLSILPPVHLDAQAAIIDIPISVVSNDELKSHMAWSMNNSVLVQSNWLEMDDPNSTPSSTDSEDFGTHVNDDIYSFMVGCVVDQAVLNGGGENGKVNHKLVGLLSGCSVLVSFWVHFGLYLACLFWVI
ncbi:hypothetical protein M5K25_003693 [Dendrobium thyrsiflorum]|uniref:DUF4283 domain-containing protein n=1 Tax=Dendrobium thyrsiflorum TaxID=117978 RepID=A0ABD0VKU3_DENTH